MVEGMAWVIAGDPTEEQDYMSMINSLLIENKQLEDRETVDCTRTQTLDSLDIQCFPITCVCFCL